MPIEKDLQYPIGHFIAPDQISTELKERWVSDLEKLPEQMWEVFRELPPGGLERTYRPGGWTIRQLFHHVGDSHLNALLRFKWALTEQQPQIKIYDEKAFAQLPDYQHTPVELSLQFLAALHQRWVYLIRSMSESDFGKTFVHPVTGTHRLDVTLGHYSWHGRHHLAHIYQALG